jgi:transposase
MPKKSTSTKGPRQRYSSEYKSEALALAAQVGVSEAAAQLKLATSQLYNWRAKAEASRERSEVDQALAAENARLKRLLAEKEQEVALLKKASAYFAKHQS